MPRRKPYVGNIVGSFPSLKMNCWIVYTSTIERDILYFLEYERDVRRYKAKPFTIRWKMPDGSIREYTPDYEVEAVSDRGILECKPANKLNAPETVQQCYIGEHWSQPNGYFFAVITDEMLREGDRLQNLKLLYKYARVHVPQWVVAQSIQAIRASRDVVTLGSLFDYLAKCGVGLERKAYVYNLVFHHVLNVDLNIAIMEDSPMWLEFRGDKDNRSIV